MFQTSEILSLPIYFLQNILSLLWEHWPLGLGLLVAWQAASSLLFPQRRFAFPALPAHFLPFLPLIIFQFSFLIVLSHVSYSFLPFYLIFRLVMGR